MQEKPSRPPLRPSGRRRAATVDPSARRQDQSGERTEHGADERCRKPYLEDGKPSSCWIIFQAEDKTGNPPDHGPHRQSDGHPLLKQGHDA